MINSECTANAQNKCNFKWNCKINLHRGKMRYELMHIGKDIRAKQRLVITNYNNNNTRVAGTGSSFDRTLYDIRVLCRTHISRTPMANAAHVEQWRLCHSKSLRALDVFQAQRWSRRSRWRMCATAVKKLAFDLKPSYRRFFFLNLGVCIPGCPRASVTAFWPHYCCVSSFGTGRMRRRPPAANAEPWRYNGLLSASPQPSTD